MVTKPDAAAPAKSRSRKAAVDAVPETAVVESKPRASRSKAAAAAVPAATADVAAKPAARGRRKADAESPAGAAPAAPASARSEPTVAPVAERPARGGRGGRGPAESHEGSAGSSGRETRETREPREPREQREGPAIRDHEAAGDFGGDYGGDPNRRRRRRGGRGRKRGEGDAPPREQQPREQQPRESQRHDGPRHDGPRHDGPRHDAQRTGPGRNQRPGGRPGQPGGLRDPRDSRGGRPDQRGRDGQRGGRPGGDYRGGGSDYRGGGGDYRGGGAGRGREAGGGALERSVPKGQLPAELIYGINAVSVALETGQLKALYYDNGFNNERVKQIHAHAQDAGIAVLPLQRQGWSKALSGEQHQGVAGMLFPQSRHYLEEIVANAGEDSCILVLDRVQDPHNLGAILRTSGAAGVDAVVLPKAGGCPVTPAVHRAAAGVSLLNRIVEDENIARALEFLKDQGYWVIGCDSEEGEDATTFEFPHKRVIVMGNEAEGMRRLVREHCDYLVRIPMPGPRWLGSQHDGASTAMVESLNVSVATAIILYLSMSDLARAAHEADGDAESEREE